MRHNWHFWIDRFGLPKAPRLVSPGTIINGAWQLRGRALTYSEPWRKLDLVWHDDHTAVSGFRRLFARCPIAVAVPAACAAPLFVELDGWASRVVLYWNGAPIGLYSEVGPQKSFYIPEGLIQSENIVHVQVDGYRGPATIGSIAAGCYYHNRRIALNV